MPNEEVGDVAVGAGFKAPLQDTPASFKLATRALDAAHASGRSGVYTLDDLGVWPALVADDDVSRTLTKRYIEPLIQYGGFGKAMIETLRGLLRNGFRIDATARELLIHPNTLRHRLQRFEELTGTNLDSTDTIVELWWALARHDCDKNRT